MKRIFSVFRDSSRQQFDELSDAIKSCDWRTCRRVAHSLKGGAASIGAARLAAVCAWIESDCADHAGTASGRILQVETIETLMRERSAVLKELEIRLFKTDPE
jgi:HPt (histidine-containing phosphotransfer) domain-containing protein